MGDFINKATPTKYRKYTPNYFRADTRKEPGRPVGVIVVREKGLPANAHNPLIIFWTVSRYRKDYFDVLQQEKKPRSLGRYSQSLFDSCFKGWTE